MLPLFTLYAILHLPQGGARARGSVMTKRECYEIEEYAERDGQPYILYLLRMGNLENEAFVGWQRRRDPR